MKKQSRTGSVTDAIINYLTMIGWLVWRNNTGGIWDAKQQLYRKNKKQLVGIPDIQGIDWIGRSVSIEVKTGTDRLSVDQTLFAAEALGRSSFYCIAKDIDDVIATLKYYGYDINDAGYVRSTTHKTLVDSIWDREDEVGFIPNANLLRRLTIMDKAKLSIYATGKIQRELIRCYLGKYTDRVIL